jgi:hypothetical protein
MIPLPLRRHGLPTAMRLYERHAAAADRGRWSVERDVRWADVDADAAHRTPDILAAMRDACLIEAVHPANLGGILPLVLDDTDACAVLSLEMYEGFKHFQALRTYLDRVAWEPAVTDADLAAARLAPDPHADAPLVERLVEFMLSEHLAVYFFRRLAERAEDPVLVELLARISADEVRHAQSASDLLAKRIAADHRLVPRVLQAAVEFQHFGIRAVGQIPVAMPGDPLAIRSFARRIERLCGVRLVDHLKASLEDHAPRTGR